MTQVRIKQGETLLLECAYTTDAGVAINVTGWTIRSQVRDTHNNLLGDLVVDLHTPVTGQFSITYANTALWPAGPARMDIAYEDGTGRVIYTDTVSISIERGITEL